MSVRKFRIITCSKYFLRLMFKYMIFCRVRDTLVDMIKAATKCNPSIQSNAILSLAGLLNIVHRYATSLEPAELKTAESSTEYKSHSHWSIIVIESLMSLVDFQYKSKGNLLGLCQQVQIFKWTISILNIWTPK